MEIFILYFILVVIGILLLNSLFNRKTRSQRKEMRRPSSTTPQNAPHPSKESPLSAHSPEKSFSGNKPSRNNHQTSKAYSQNKKKKEKTSLIPTNQKEKNAIKINSAEEARKAIIYSEILNRKY